MVDAVQAVKMTNARGEIKYPIKVGFLDSQYVCSFCSEPLFKRSTENTNLEIF